MWLPPEVSDWLHQIGSFGQVWSYVLEYFQGQRQQKFQNEATDLFHASRWAPQNSGTTPGSSSVKLEKLYTLALAAKRLSVDLSMQLLNPCCSKNTIHKAQKTDQRH